MKFAFISGSEKVNETSLKKYHKILVRYFANILTVSALNDYKYYRIINIKEVFV